MVTWVTVVAHYHFVEWCHPHHIPLPGSPAGVCVLKIYVNKQLEGVVNES